MKETTGSTIIPDTSLRLLIARARVRCDIRYTIYGLLILNTVYAIYGVILLQYIIVQ
jgi:hypothetical protein